MRGGLERWKRGAESRGVRHALSYAHEGACDAHTPYSAGADALEAYGPASDLTVSRFIVDTGVIATDQLTAGGLRVGLTGHDPATLEERGHQRLSPDVDLLLDGTLNHPKSYSVAALLHPELAGEFEALQDRLRERILLTWQTELNGRRRSRRTARLIAEWSASRGGPAPTVEALHQIDRRAWAVARPNKPVDLDEMSGEARVRDEIAAMDPTLLAARAPITIAPTDVDTLDLDLLVAAAIVDADEWSTSCGGRFSSFDLRAGALRALSHTGIVAPREQLDAALAQISARATQTDYRLIGEVELDTVHRFHDPEYAALTLRLREASDRGGALTVASELAERGHVVRVDHHDAGRDRMIDAYFEWHARGKRVALVSATNAESDAINDVIQQRRVDHGKLDPRVIAWGIGGAMPPGRRHRANSPQ